MFVGTCQLRTLPGQRAENLHFHGSFRRFRKRRDWSTHPVSSLFEIASLSATTQHRTGCPRWKLEPHVPHWSFITSRVSRAQQPSPPFRDRHPLYCHTDGPFLVDRTTAEPHVSLYRRPWGCSRHKGCVVPCAVIAVLRHSTRFLVHKSVS